MRAALPGIGCGLTETEAEAPEQLHGGQRRVGPAMQVPQAVEPFEGQGEHHQQPVNEEAVFVVVGHMGDPITGLEDWQRPCPPRP